MTQCWHHLNLDTTNAIRKDWKFPDPQYNVYGVWFLWAWDVFEPKWLQAATKLGLEFSSLMLFYRGPYMSTRGAHIDIVETDPLEIGTYAVNWIIGGRGSEMVWYNLPSGELPISYTSAKTAYTYWPTETLTEIDRCAIATQPTLVKIGMPHSIEMGPEERWCISARPRLKTKMEWGELLDHLRKLNLLVER